MAPAKTAWITSRNGGNLEPRLRVIFIIPGKNEGVSMIFSRSQAEALRKTSIDVKEFYLFSRTNPIFIARDLVRLLREINRFRPQILHAHYGTMTAFFSMVASFLSRVPLIITFRGSDLNQTAQVDGFWRDLVGRFLSQVSTLKAKRIICVSQGLKNRLWWRKDSTSVIPTGVNMEIFQPISVLEARQKLGWDPARKVVLFCSTNPQVKRLDFAKATVEEAAKKFPGLQLEILSGDTSQKMMSVYLSAANCLIVCSLFEGSPSIIKEALACNLPIVANDVGDIAERLQGVYPSEIVPLDLGMFAETIIRIIKLNQRTNGREIAQNQFTTEVDAQKTISEYYKVMN